MLFFHLMRYATTWLGRKDATHILVRNSLVEPIPLLVWFRIQSFPSPRLVAMPRLKSPGSPTIYP